MLAFLGAGWIFRNECLWTLSALSNSNHRLRNAGANGEFKWEKTICANIKVSLQNKKFHFYRCWRCDPGSHSITRLCDTYTHQTYNEIVYNAWSALTHTHKPVSTYTTEKLHTMKKTMLLLLFVSFYLCLQKTHSLTHAETCSLCIYKVNFNYFYQLLISLWRHQTVMFLMCSLFILSNMIIWLKA